MILFSWLYSSAYCLSTGSSISYQSSQGTSSTYILQKFVQSGAGQTRSRALVCRRLCGRILWSRCRRKSCWGCVFRQVLSWCWLRLCSPSSWWAILVPHNTGFETCWSEWWAWRQDGAAAMRALMALRSKTMQSPAAGSHLQSSSACCRSMHSEASNMWGFWRQQIRSWSCYQAFRTPPSYSRWR